MLVIIAFLFFIIAFAIILITAVIISDVFISTESSRSDRVFDPSAEPAVSEIVACAVLVPCIR
ncbi:hypothetical protein HGRIS_011093 [Hohenbuehelia grisea]|uniref:Uncharacterized protein n=1 Tax=Hohenbuehelia grisea TaxID=104357 RepID=A0ABR3IZ29_9AGAR